MLLSNVQAYYCELMKTRRRSAKAWHSEGTVDGWVVIWQGMVYGANPVFSKRLPMEIAFPKIVSRIGISRAGSLFCFIPNVNQMQPETSTVINHEKKVRKSCRAHEHRNFYWILDHRPAVSQKRILHVTDTCVALLGTRLFSERERVSSAVPSKQS